MQNLYVTSFTNVKYKFAKKSSSDFDVQASIVKWHSRTKLLNCGVAYVECRYLGHSQSSNYFQSRIAILKKISYIRI